MLLIERDDPQEETEREVKVLQVEGKSHTVCSDVAAGVGLTDIENPQ